MSTLEQKEAHFVSATKYAVVGASTNPSKYGSKLLKALVDKQKDVVPINSTAAEIQGIRCLQNISQLPDPTHTAVCIVVRPKETLKILKEAKRLGIFALWLQPGTVDEEILQFLHADQLLDARTVYNRASLHEHIPAPVRTRSKPDPLTNLPKQELVATGPVEDTTPPCLFRDEILGIKAAVKAVVAPVAPAEISSTKVAVKVAPVALEEKKALFLSAPKFAVVGASTNDKKYGAMALKHLVDLKKDVVPINLKATVIQGLKCLSSISQLPDPTNTAVCIVVPPKATLDVLKQALSLNVFALWLQPGAEDDAVLQYMAANPQLDARSVYTSHPLHTSTAGHAPKQFAAGPIEDTTPICLFTVTTPTPAPAPAPASAPTLAPLPTPALAPAPAPATADPLAASNLVAGVKRDMQSPPATPPVSKSLKLAPDDNTHTFDLGQEIPGLA